MPKAKEKPILLLVDGHSLAFRSFYAFSKGGEGGLATKEGFPTSVTYGFLKSLLDNCKTLCPEGITITTPQATEVVIKGIDKQLVGQFSARIREIRKPEPYKGKGIRYTDEYVRKKAGKTVGGAS